MPDGWTAMSYLAAYGGSLIMAYSGSIMTPTYDMNGYDKVTVIVKAAAYGNNSATMRVSTGSDYQDLSLTGDFTEYTIVLDCNALDAVKLANAGNNTYSSVKGVTVYAGELTTSLRATETGDETSRLITGITDMFYTVEGLLAEGTFIYRVKTQYIDGTESAWSNKQQVTLFENGHGFEPGDVDHDGSLTIADVTRLIDYVLNEQSLCTICADVDQDGEVTINDITALIDLILN